MVSEVLEATKGTKLPVPTLCAKASVWKWSPQWVPEFLKRIYAPHRIDFLRILAPEHQACDWTTQDVVTVLGVFNTREKKRIVTAILAPLVKDRLVLLALLARGDFQLLLKTITVSDKPLLTRQTTRMLMELCEDDKDALQVLRHILVVPNSLKDDVTMSLTAMLRNFPSATWHRSMYLALLMASDDIASVTDKELLTAALGQDKKGGEGPCINDPSHSTSTQDGPAAEDQPTMSCGGDLGDHPVPQVDK